MYRYANSVEFKDRLKAWRKENDLLQKQAADRLSVSTATIRKWENGKRTPHKLHQAELDRRMGIPDSFQQAMREFKQGKVVDMDL